MAERVCRSEFWSSSGCRQQLNDEVEQALMNTSHGCTDIVHQQQRSVQPWLVFENALSASVHMSLAVGASNMLRAIHALVCISCTSSMFTAPKSHRRGKVVETSRRTWRNMLQHATHAQPERDKLVTVKHSLRLSHTCCPHSSSTSLALLAASRSARHGSCPCSYCSTMRGFFSKRFLATRPRPQKSGQLIVSCGKVELPLFSAALPTGSPVCLRLTPHLKCATPSCALRR